MLEVKIPGMRNGHMYKAGESLTKGTIGFINGVDTNGYLLIKKPRSLIQSIMSVYPFNEILYKEDGSDTASAQETISSGERLIVFENGGEYVTDKFVHTAIGSTAAPSAFFWDTAANITDTATYTKTLGIGGLPLVVCYASGKEGYLTATAGGSIARLNKNIMATRVYDGMYAPNARLAFRIFPQARAFRGQYIASAMGATAYAPREETFASAVGYF